MIKYNYMSTSNKPRKVDYYAQGGSAEFEPTLTASLVVVLCLQGTEQHREDTAQDNIQRYDLSGGTGMDKLRT